MLALVQWYAFTLLVTLISASPATPTALLEVQDVNVNAVEKRNVGGVYICTGTNWSGTCGYAVQPLNTCIVLGSDWKDKIGSFGPDSCTMCFAYETNSCGFGDGFFWMFQYPGDASGGKKVAGNSWSSRIGSFKCWRSPDCMS